MAMVFQSYALYPHKTVQANIEFPLKVRGVSRSERAAQAKVAAASLGLDGLLDRKPGQLSGGQRQRVALARAIVRHPAVFCMDEPLSNLDAKLRGRDPRRARRAARPAGQHLPLRHPRPGRGDDDGHAHRGDERRAAPAGRHAGARSTAGRRRRSSPSSSARRR